MTYWRQPFNALAAIPEMIEFVVLDVDFDGRTKGKMALADIEVARSSDMGTNNDSYWVKSHLGGILHPGDTAMGYFLTNSNLNNPEYENMLKLIQNLPDVVLVKKVFVSDRNGNQARFVNWIKTLARWCPGNRMWRSWSSITIFFWRRWKRMKI